MFGILSLILSIVSALYLQLPTFFLLLGYGWSHNYSLKRWIFRILALATFIIFISTNPTTCVLLSIAIPFTLFWIFSLFNANPNLFIALDDKKILKQKDRIYSDNIEVVGYTDDKENSICYPIDEMIMPRHILNDMFCEKPLLVSYCAACRSTMLYNPIVDGLRLTFEVIGVHRRNMIIRDLQTGTIWQQGTGEAMLGKLKGKQLEFCYYRQTTLANWIKQNPDTFIAKESDNIRKSFVPKERLLKVLKKVTGNFVAPGKTDLNGLALREKIWGLKLNGQSKAYPISELKKVTKITDNLGGVNIVIQYNPDTNQIDGTNKITNERLKFQNHWWFGWKEFHPDTEIWKAK
ncbi:DUF3179 domain-containing protein [Bacteroidales bacterium OttesenSCG-928-I21]|nr:DUF3179 domain-containing protein [Bacteroidales bacterium OttesenSCG-928-I21]